MNITQRNLEKKKNPLKSLALKFLKVVMLLVCLTGFIKTEIEAEKVVFIVFSIMFFILLWSEFIHKQFVQNEILYTKIAKNISIVVTLAVWLPVITILFWDKDMDLLKIAGSMNDSLRGLFVHVFGAFIIIGLFFSEIFFLKTDKLTFSYPTTFNFIITAGLILLYVVCSELNILDGDAKLFLTFSICISFIATGLGMFVLIIILFILSIVKTMRGKWEG